MSEYLHAKHAKNEDYEKLVELMDTAFSFPNYSFPDLLPKLYNKDRNDISQQLCVDVNGEFRSTIGLFYNTVDVCGEKIKSCGIGNVCVKKEYRNQYYMKFNMSCAMDEIKQKFTDFAFLSGQRQRYGYYSFELGGVSYSFDFKTVNVKHLFGKYEKCGCEAIELKDNDSCEELIKINENRPCHFDRKKLPVNEILRSWFDKPYKVMKDGGFIGYFVAEKNPENINEIGYTDEKYIPDILRTALDISGKNIIRVSCPPFDTPLYDFLTKYGDNFYIRSSEQFSVLNYQKIIRAYLNLKKTYKNLADGETVLLINTPIFPEKIYIGVKNNNVTVEDTNLPADIQLEHLEAMRLLFSISSEKRRLLNPAAASWFPLPLYVWPSDSV